jgi:UDP-glucose 4-epimerase
MSTPRYLVTGGAGFIGSNLVAALTAAGERVRALDNLSTGRWEHLDGIPQQTLIERIEGDIRDAAVVARASKGVEVVFHEAALGSVPRSVEAPIESDAVNLGGTVTVLDVARHQGVRRVIFAASSAAYGETPALPKHEDMAPMPLSPYAVTKLGCEQYLKVFADLYNLETLNLRYFNVFGPNQTPDGAYAAAIPRFLDAAITGRPIQIYGDGEQTRDFCYIDNTVRANLLAATSPRKLAGEIVNIAGGRRIGLNDLCREIGRLMDGAVAVEHVAARAGDIRHSLADITRAQELLGYEPKVRWEDGLPATLAYLRTLRGEGPTQASHHVTAARVGVEIPGLRSGGAA